MNDLLLKLSAPFEPKYISFKPGATKGDKAMALAYADLRAYMDRLDDACGLDWSVAYEPWGDSRIIARLTIAGVTRASTGEMDAGEEKGGNGGTVAEAQAFKRAATMFGLGRSIYDLPSPWVDFDPQSKRITPSALAQLEARYLAWYTKTMAAIAAKRTLPVTVPVRVVDADTGEITTLAVDADVLFTPTVHGPTQDTGVETPPHQRLFGQLSSGFGPDAEAVRPWLIEKWTTLVSPESIRTSAKDLSDTEKDVLADYIKEDLAVLQRAWRSHKAAARQATTSSPKAATRSTKQPVANGVHA